MAGKSDLLILVGHVRERPSVRSHAPPDLIIEPGPV